MTGSEGSHGSRHEVAVTKARHLDLRPMPPVAGSPSTLPNEVFLIIFELLEKNQLKAVRRVCKLFALLVSPLLFDLIYISPHRPNLDVFRQISGNKDLCTCPRTLVYDVQEFKENIDTQEYYKDLCRQLHSFLISYPITVVKHVDKELEAFLRLVKVSPNPKFYGSNEFSAGRVVQRGLELYSERAEEQDHYSDGELLACLCIGLMKLIHVDQVKFQYYWTDRHLRPIDWSKNPRDLRLSPSPLARSWSPFHLRPSSIITDTPTTLEFDNVISAFSLTGRPLRLLTADSPPSVAYEVFHSKSFMSRTFRQHSFPAMYYLESLTMRINMRHYSQSGSADSTFEEPKEKTLPVDLLAAALSRLPWLRSLSLEGILCKTGNGMISMSELFQTSTWPALEVLDLSGMLGSSAHISAFLQAQPRLRKLSLRSIELSQGTWAGVVDDMRRCLFLDSLDLQLFLREDGGVDLWDEKSWEDMEMSERIERYVLQGGQNPLRAPG